MNWQDAFNSPNKVKCDCPWPSVQRSGSQALGLVLDIDLCCLARAVEELTGKKFYTLVEADPEFVWDCKGDGLNERRCPPKFMEERLLARGWRHNHE